MARVLLADSQPLFNEALEALLSRGDAHQVLGRCSSAEDAFAHVSSLRPDLVLVDASLGLEGSPNLEKLGMHSKLEAATFAMQRSTELEPIPGAGLGS
jgi:chemotaxis response regulator CheB